MKIRRTQRNSGKFQYVSKKWEFPGGKIEKNEDKEVALKRELNEELSLNVNPKKNNFILSTNHSYPDFEINIDFYQIDLNDNDERNLILNNHIQYRKLDVINLHSLDWAAADLPMVRFLQDKNNGFI